MADLEESPAAFALVDDLREAVRSIAAANALKPGSVAHDASAAVVNYQSEGGLEHSNIPHQRQPCKDSRTRGVTAASTARKKPAPPIRAAALSQLHRAGKHALTRDAPPVGVDLSKLSEEGIYLVLAFRLRIVAFGLHLSSG